MVVVGDPHGERLQKELIEAVCRHVPRVERNPLCLAGGHLSASEETPDSGPCIFGFYKPISLSRKTHEATQAS
jgi:hypothetical protein